MKTKTRNKLFKMKEVKQKKLKRDRKPWIIQQLNYYYNLTK